MAITSEILGKLVAKGIASKRKIVMTASSGNIELASSFTDDGLSYQTLSREIRVRKPVFLHLFWEGTGSLNLSMWNHGGTNVTTWGELSGGGQSHTVLRLAPPEGASATFVPNKDSGTTGTLWVYVEQAE